MAEASLGPGDDVEAWCTRCRMDLNHIIIAVVGREIKRVQCLTCGGDHVYRPPKYERTTTKTETGRRPASKRGSGETKVREAARAEGEWSTFMKEMPQDTVPVAYRMSDAYEADQYVEHPVFGTGRVLEIVGREKISVIFQSGRKVLLCNRKTP